MSEIEKLKKRFNKKPTPNDITIDEIEKLARYYGCIIKTGGNHQVRIVNPKNGMVVPLPQHDKGIKPPYIRELIELFADSMEE